MLLRRVHVHLLRSRASGENFVPSGIMTKRPRDRQDLPREATPGDVGQRKTAHFANENWIQMAEI
jgi:hypothetical protein